MKKVFMIIIMAVSLLFGGLAIASEIDKEIELKNAKIEALNWESNYLQQRFNVIRGTLQVLQKELQELKTKKSVEEANKTSEKPKK